MPIPIHFVGSVPLDTSSEVLSTLANAFAPNVLQRIPDGEPGKRHYFVLFQRDVYEDAGLGHVLTSSSNPAALEPEDPRKVQQTAKDIPRLKTGYDTAALESYAEFRKLKDASSVGDGVKFQVCFPTLASFLGTNVKPEYQAIMEPYHEAALSRALENVQAQIPHSELAIQIDIAMEFAFLHGVTYDFLPPLGRYLPASGTPELMKALVDRIARLIDAVDSDVEVGLHLCYGDVAKHHFCEPDTAMIADLATHILGAAKHPISWIHLPVPKDREDEAYLRPLKPLLSNLPTETLIYLGLVHEYDLGGTQRRLQTAQGLFGGRPFGIATECGLGRRNKEDLDSVIAIMTQLST